MISDASIAPVAALIADPTRAVILCALADGRVRPAGELAREAGVSASTASEHLSRLLEGGLVEVERHGRHRYYRVSGERVVTALEAIGALARPGPALPHRRAAVARGLRHARACYDHLAGTLGVALARALVERGVLHSHNGHYELPEAGSRFLADGLGVDVARARASRRQFARACLDWTERSHHIAGALGAELLRRLLELGWLERSAGSRILRVTHAGRRGFQESFEIDALALRYQ